VPTANLERWRVTVVGTGAAMVFLSTLVAPAAWGQSTGSPAAPASDSGKVPEIIVTAQRRSESLQNTPIAVTAITGDALAGQHIDDISNISAVTPSVNFQSTNNAQASANLEIRGIGTVGNNPRFRGLGGRFRRWGVPEPCRPVAVKFLGF